MSMSPNRTFFDAHEIHEASTLKVVASPSADSNSSVGTGSPTLLNTEPSDIRLSLGSSPHGTPTVKFAPLPQIDPTRKRSLAPLGVSARSRRRRLIEQEGDSMLWRSDPDMEENTEDPFVTFAKLVRKTGKTLWRRVRKSNRPVQAPPLEDVLSECSAEPILDIKSTGAEQKCHGCVSEVVGGEDNKRGRPSSWSPSEKRRTLSLDEAKRRSTSDLVRVRVVV